MEKKESLLDVLAEKLGCYVSDLRTLENFTNEGISLICSTIQEIPEGKFDLTEWSEIAYYMFDKHKLFSSEKEAKDYFCRRLT